MSPLAGRVPRAALVAGGLAVLIAAYFVGREAAAAVPRFAAWVDGLGVWGPVAFIAGYGVAAVALIPGSLLTLAAGAIFGLGPGVTYVMAGATLGATLAFLSGRYLARGFVERLLAGDPRLSAIDSAVGRQGFKLVLLLRLSPVVPFNLLNYVLGLSQVRLAHYVCASIGMLPAVVLYVYTGKVAGDLASLASGQAAPRGAGYYGLVVLGLAATVAVTIAVTRLAKRAVDDAVGK